MGANQCPEASQGKLIVLGAKEIRRVWRDNQWFFSVVDIVGALTDSENPRDYWYRMKQRELESSGVELSTLSRRLRLKSADVLRPRAEYSKAMSRGIMGV